MTISDTLNAAKVPAYAKSHGAVKDWWTAKLKRYLEWNYKLKTKAPDVYYLCGGKFPLPEDLPPGVVDVLSKVLVAELVGSPYGDAKIDERMEYGENLVRHANLELPSLPPFFAKADVENGDMYIWTLAAHMYGEYLVEQPGFLTTTSGIARDVFRIQHPYPSKEHVARPASSARTNKKKARPKVVAATSRAEQKPPVFRSYARLRWKSAIRMQIKLNRMYRQETAKNIVESMRRQKTPNVGDQAKRECHKAESIEKSNEHRRWLQEKESLRIAQAEQKLEALHIASLIQNGDAP